MFRKLLEGWKKTRRGDRIIIGLALILGLAGILYPFLWDWLVGTPDNLQVIIHSLGAEKQIVPMGSVPPEGRELQVEGPIGDHLVQIKQEGVRVIAPEADPLKICEKTGWIRRPGATIVCVPNQLAVWLEGRDEHGLDGISE